MNAASMRPEWLPNYSYKDYEKWDGDWELINGFPYAMSPGPLRSHQVIGGRFVHLAIEQLKKNEIICACEVLYETDWIITEQTVVRPDVMILCDTPPSDFVKVPPVLIMEIFSPSTRLKDRNLKFKLYEESGVKYYLMADPEKKSVESFYLKNNGFEEYNEKQFTLSSSFSIELDLTSIWL